MLPEGAMGYVVRRELDEAFGWLRPMRRTRALQTFFLLAAIKQDSAIS